MRKKSLLVTLIVVLLLFSARSVFIPSVHAQVLFADNFSTGDFSKWTTEQYLSIQSSVVYDGDSYAAMCTATGSAEGAYARFIEGTSYPALYMRAYVYWTSAQSIGSSQDFMAVVGSNGYDLAYLSIGNDAGQMQWTLYNNDDALYYAVNATISTNTWYCVEIMCSPETSSGGTNGEMTLWVNGTELLDVTGQTFGTTGVDGCELTSGIVGTYITQYWAEVVLGTSYNGPISTTRAQSNTLVFSDGFSSGTELTNQTPAGAWDGNYLPDGEPGSNTVQSSIFYGDSNYAANFTATDFYQYGCVYKNLSSYNALESSTMIYLSEVPDNAVVGTTLCEDYDHGIFFTMIEYGYWAIDVWGTDYFESTPSNPSPNTWYNVTLYGQTGDNGAAYLWVNGVLKVSVSGISVDGQIACVRDEFWLDANESSPISCYTDDIAVYAPSSEQPSPGSPSPGPPNPSGPPGTFGYTTVGSSTVSGSSSTANLMCGYCAVPSESGVVNSISAYVYAQSGTVDLEGALYTYVSPGTPGTLIANTSKITVGTTPEWNNMTFSSPPYVTSGTLYWIVWWQDGNSSYCYDMSNVSGWGFYIWPSSTFPNWPTSISDQTSSSAQTSVYATYSYLYANLTVGVSGHGVTNATGTSIQYQYDNVSVLAAPDPGYVLSYWMLNGTDVGSANPYTVNMTDNLSLTAVFSSAVYLILNVYAQTTYAGGQSVCLDVTVLNEAGSPVNSTLTLTVTGSRSYGYFDFDRINATVGSSDYSFTWAVPKVAGTYIVEVSLVPMQLTAYDAAWLQVV